MIYNKSFLKGNFDKVYILISEELPQKLKNLKQNILPQIDSFLNQMLQGFNSIEKTSIFLELNEDFSAFILHLIYTVSDFQVSDAPADAIETDTNTLKKFLTFEGLTMKDLKIDVNDGTLKIDYLIPFEVK